MYPGICSLGGMTSNDSFSTVMHIPHLPHPGPGLRKRGKARRRRKPQEAFRGQWWGLGGFPVPSLLWLWSIAHSMAGTSGKLEVLWGAESQAQPGWQGSCSEAVAGQCDPKIRSWAPLYWVQRSGQGQGGAGSTGSEGEGTPVLCPRPQPHPLRASSQGPAPRPVPST